MKSHALAWKCSGSIEYIYLITHLKKRQTPRSILPILVISFQSDKFHFKFTYIFTIIYLEFFYAI